MNCSDGTQGLFGSKLTWLGFHGTCSLRTTGLAKPFVYSCPQSIAIAQRYSETWKIHAGWPRTSQVFAATAQICLLPSLLAKSEEAADKAMSTLARSGGVCCQGSDSDLQGTQPLSPRLGCPGLWPK